LVPIFRREKNEFLKKELIKVLGEKEKKFGQSFPWI
jgi:hypothetical protein